MENLSDRIKLPSNWMLVNSESIWKYLVAISKTGNVFNREQLIKSGLYTNNEDNISRNLSYLKYLKFIEEERSKGKVQRFKVCDVKDVTDLFYELKAGRESQALEKFKEHLSKHVLFTTIRDDFFGNKNDKTLNDLEHFIRDGIPGKGPTYYQKGGQFLIKLLQSAQLTTLNGNDITLSNSGSEDEKMENNDHSFEILRQNTEDVKIEAPSPRFEDAQIVQSNGYQIHFRGPGMDSRLEIFDLDDLLIVEATLAKIKKKLNEIS